jgi:hypothetical protein
MADILIFGVDSSIITICTELAVALTTVILAYFTYQSVKISRITLDSLKDEVDLAKKDFENKQTELEKPQIVDQLREVINPLYEKIDLEINQIDEKSLLWKSEVSGGCTLFFRTRSSGEFYTEANINTRSGIIVYEINASFPSFKELCQKRYKIHLSIVDLFAKIYQLMKEPHIDGKIVELISKKNPSIEIYDINNEYLFDAIPLWNIDKGTPPYFEIPVSDFQMMIINAAIAEMLGQRSVPHDSYDKTIISVFPTYENDMKNVLKSESFGECSKSFHSLIEELKFTNTQLKNEILKIKMEYREKYHLNDKEYWAIFKNTS